MVRITNKRKQKGGDLTLNINTRLRTGTIEHNGKTYEIKSGADLKGANLEYANLERACLERANLKGADLGGADLWNADLTGANLRGANLSDADLEGVKLYKADLKGADLGGADLWTANLEDANLERACLERANLKDAVLTGAKLYKADLHSALLGGANLSDANLERACLERANLKDAVLTGAKLYKADLRGANLSDADLEGADLGRIIYDEYTKWPTGYIPPAPASAPASAPAPTSTSITLNKNMLSSSNSNSCNDKLYNKIINTSIEDLINKNFEVTGQTGIDIGGITRIVHDLFLKSFINKFFTGEDKKILKPKLDKELLNKATYYLSILTQKTKRVFTHYGEETLGSINVIPINNNLLQVLLSDNMEDYITQTQNNKYHIQKTNNHSYNLLKKENRIQQAKNIFINETNIPLSSLLENASTNFNNVNYYRGATEEQKAKMLLITFLSINGFTSYQQFVNMREWIQNYWKINLESFSNNLSFDKETFFQRVILVFGNNTIELDKFMNLDIKEKEELYSFNSPSKLFIEYLNDNDQYRMNFNRLVSGSFSYAGILRIYFTASIKNKLYYAQTCANEIKVYNADVSSMNMEILNGAIEGEFSRVNIQN